MSHPGREVEAPEAATATPAAGAPAGGLDLSAALGAGGGAARLSGLARASADTRAAAFARGGGNAVLARAALAARQPAPAAPPPTQDELNGVVDLMPIQPDIDALMTSVEAGCEEWRAWREKLKGPVPGSTAFSAMTTFKDAVRSRGFDAYDERIQTIARNRITGDKRQLLTEMSSFALGTNSGKGGDPQGLARLCGIQAKPMRHNYTLKISYSITVKGEVIVGGGYTYRSAAMVYSNDFGMGYNKPLNMRSGMVSAGPEAGASAGGLGGQAEGSDSSFSFWDPDDFETSFSVSKIAAGAAVGEKKEIKFHEMIRVTSPKHPPLLFDLMGGSHVAPDSGVEAGAGGGAGVEVELGKMVGGPDVGETTTTTPALEDARKNAEKSGLIPEEQQAMQWLVVGATVVNFATGSAMVEGTQGALVAKFAKFVAKWATDNPGSQVRFEIVGQASPRWRHPTKGRIAADLNQQLSVQRGENVRAALQGGWDGSIQAQYDATGVMGPDMEMNDDTANVRGRGSLDGLAETHDPDNNDAAYRTAAVTAWGKKAADKPATP
jgi:hypothetical protein